MGTEPERHSDNVECTVLGSLVDAVGEDAAVSVALWLSDVLEDHSLEVDGRVISPSVEWLAEAVTPTASGRRPNDGD